MVLTEKEAKSEQRTWRLRVYPGRARDFTPEKGVAGEEVCKDDISPIQKKVHLAMK